MVCIRIRIQAVHNSKQAQENGPDSKDLCFPVHWNKWSPKTMRRTVWGQSLVHQGHVKAKP